MTTPPLALSLDHRLLRDVAHDRMLDAIVTGRLQPGELVSAEELDAIAGTSRTPVRHAVARLVEIGLLEVEPQKHTRVAPLDRHMLGRRIEMLGALYAAAVEVSVATLTEADLHRLDRAVDRFAADPDSRARGTEVSSFFTVFREAVSNVTFERVRERVFPHIRRALRLHLVFDFEPGLPLMRMIRDASHDRDASAAAAGARAFFTEFMPALLASVPMIESAAGVGDSRPERRRLLRDDVHESILAAIVDGRLAPGELLHDGELAETLGVSRAPVREAFLRLSDIGLVDVLPYRHTVVNGVTHTAVREALFVTGALVGHAALRAVPEIGEPDLEALEGIALRVERDFRDGELGAFGDGVQDYVGTLAQLGGNVELVETIDSVSPILQNHLRIASDGYGSRRVLRMIRRVNAASRRRDAVAVHGAIGEFHDECRRHLRGPAARA